MKTFILLTNGGEALIDKRYFNKVSKYKWYKHTVNKHTYVWRTSRFKGKMIKLHTFLMRTPKGMMVDHINGDGLDNRKSNLRLCLPCENSRNQKLKSKNTSGYKGIHFSKPNKKWVARIGVNYKRICIGSFIDKIDAIHAYNKYCLKYHGKFARPNEL